MAVACPVRGAIPSATPASTRARIRTEGGAAGLDRVPKRVRAGARLRPLCPEAGRPPGRTGHRGRGGGDHRGDGGLRRAGGRGSEPRAGATPMKRRPADDPVFVEVAWNRLISIVEQEAQALLRT